MPTIHCAKLNSSCRTLIWLVALASLLTLRPASGDGPALTGEQIYRQNCASCHGASGEGTEDHYPRPLIGERPVRLAGAVD